MTSRRGGVLTIRRGESGIGKWTVIVKDTKENEFNGTFIDWRLNFWGEAINAQVQGLHALPDEHDDDHETAAADVSTTSVDAGSHPTTIPAQPTDHIDRPTKPKPSDESEVISSELSSSETKAVPAATSTGTSIATESATATDSTAAATHTYSESFLPGFFPTFGVSKRTQIWIYGSLGLIIVFCAGLGAYFFVQRRKRLRSNPRDAYEFEMVGGEDAEEQQGLKSRSRGGRVRRGGELYDAFAGESDDELYSDDEGYQDTPSNDTGSGSRDENSEEKS